MEPKDDPEARIRELERPLTDQAYTSELGGSHTYPPPPPPLADGISFGTTRARSTGRVWWIVAAVIILGVVGLVVGIMVYVGSVFSSSTSSFTSTPGMFGGDGSFSERPSSVPKTAVRPSISKAPRGGRLSIAGVGKSETIECNDSDVSVSGMSNTVVFTGHCADVSVSGMKNDVTVEAADKITASGFENKVTYQSGSPVINNAGESNSIQQG